MSDFSSLEKSVIKTLCWFDIFDRPLTLFELHKFLYEVSDKIKLSDLQDSLIKMAEVSQKQGFYFLSSKQKLVSKRIEQEKIAADKIKLAHKAAKKICHIAGIKMIGLCNNWYLREGSDIDFFIITAKDRIWLTRLLTTAWLHFLRLRRHGSKVADRICLSFYVAENNLDIDKIKIKPEDPYLDFWAVNMLPIFDRGGFYQKFLDSNSWLKQKFVNFSGNQFVYSYQIKPRGFYAIIYLLHKIIFNSFVGGWLEKITKFIQKKKMSYNDNSLANKEDSRVVVSDVMLKFHENDRRKYYYQKYVENKNKR